MLEFVIEQGKNGYEGAEIELMERVKMMEIQR